MPQGRFSSEILNQVRDDLMWWLIPLVFWIGKIAVEGRVVVGDAAINFLVEVFNIASAGSGEREGIFELGEIIGLDSDMEFTERGESEPEHAARDSVLFDGLIFDVIVEPIFDRGNQFTIG